MVTSESMDDDTVYRVRLHYQMSKSIDNDTIYRDVLHY